MPMYDHQCECGAQTSEFRRLSRWDRLPTCPDCGKKMPQIFTTQAVRGDYKKPIRMQSMGFLAVPEDVAEHRKRFPNVDLSFEEGSAIPVMRNLNQKRAYLKGMGWVDRRSFA